MEEKKRWIQAVFDRAAPEYGGERSPFFGTFGARLVELAKIAPDMHVLDVACGKGAALFPAAKRVGPQGCVTGIDLSAEMVQQTTERA